MGDGVVWRLNIADMTKTIAQLLLFGLVPLMAFSDEPQTVASSKDLFGERGF